MDVCIILPTYNEEDSIEELIHKIKEVNSTYKILVVDSNSTDATIRLARMCNVDILLVRDKRGKGHAIHETFKKLNYEYVILLDSDLSYSPEEIPEFIKQLDKYDIVSGSRFLGIIEKDSISSINMIGNIIITIIGTKLFNVKSTDICTGFWGFRKSVYTKMIIDAPHFELEANFFTEILRNKLNYCEIPISYKKRVGTSKINVLDGIRIVLYLIKRRLWNGMECD